MPKDTAKETNYFKSEQSLKLIKKIEEILKDAPHLPKSWIEFLVKLIPWLSLVGGIFSVFSAINYFKVMRGVNKMLRAFAPMMNINPIYYISMSVLMILLGILYIKAFNPLKEQKEMGWIYLFYGQIIFVIQTVLGIIFYYQKVFGAVLATFIGLYLLFEIKKEYK